MTKCLKTGVGAARGHQQQDKSVKDLKKVITKCETGVKGDTERNKTKSGRCTKNTHNIAGFFRKRIHLKRHVEM
jgi:hypothetical protein